MGKNALYMGRNLRNNSDYTHRKITINIVICVFVKIVLNSLRPSDAYMRR